VDEKSDCVRTEVAADAGVILVRTLAIDRDHEVAVIHAAVAAVTAEDATRARTAAGAKTVAAAKTAAGARTAT
jgi:hypothetical protein